MIFQALQPHFWSTSLSETVKVVLREQEPGHAPGLWHSTSFSPFTTVSCFNSHQHKGTSPSSSERLTPIKRFRTTLDIAMDTKKSTLRCLQASHKTTIISTGYWCQFPEKKVGSPPAPPKPGRQGAVTQGLCSWGTAERRLAARGSSPERRNDTKHAWNSATNNFNYISSTHFNLTRSKEMWSNHTISVLDPSTGKGRREGQATRGYQKWSPGSQGQAAIQAGGSSIAPDQWGPLRTLRLQLTYLLSSGRSKGCSPRTCFYLKCALLKRLSLWRGAGWTYWNFWTAGHHCWTLWPCSWQVHQMSLTGTVLVSPSACCGFLALGQRLPKQLLSSEFGKQGMKSPLPRHHQCPKHHWCSGQTRGNWRPSYFSEEPCWLLTVL